MELTKAEEHRGGLSQPILFWVLGAATIVGTIWSAIADGVAWYHLIPLAIGGLFAWNGGHPFAQPARERTASRAAPASRRSRERSPSRSRA